MTEILITCQPESADLATNEMRRAAPAMRLAGELAPGVLRIELPIPFEALAEAWRAAPPIFIRHMCPVQTSTSADLDAMRAALREGLIARIVPDRPFSVQTRVLDDAPLKAFQVNEALAVLIREQTGAALDVRAPWQTLSVALAGGAAYLGVSRVADNLSDWAGGVHRFAREPEQISRSEFKLLEALDVFRIRPAQLAPRGQALDLGAAPGGWTRILRQFGQFVTAIDPAALDPRVSADPGVRYKAMPAEIYLRRDPDPCDILVNDMRMDARDSARLMVDYARLLRPGGFAIMTLKLPGGGRASAIDRAFDILRRGYVIAGARQLFHNRREITVSLSPLP